MRPATPRIYADVLQHLVLHGTTPSSIVTLPAGTLNSGASVANLVTGRVQERTSLDTSGHTTTDVLFAIDLQSTAWTIGWVGVLGHNLHTAEGALSALHHTSAITGLNVGSATAVTLASKVNDRDEVTGLEDADGDTVAAFTPVAGKRYWCIRVADVSGFSATDLTIGRIMLGLYWTAPFGCDQSAWAPGFEVDVDLSTGPAGARSAAVGFTLGSEGSADGSPFRGVLARALRHAGRRIVPVGLTMYRDTDMLPADLATGIGTGACFHDVYSLAGGPALPVIVTPDAASAVPGDYMLARMVKVAPYKTAITQLVNTEVTFEEEF